MTTDGLRDPATCAALGEFRTHHVELEMDVDVAGRRVSGVATLAVKRLEAGADATRLRLDVFHLTIHSVSVALPEEDTLAAQWSVLPFTSFGEALEVEIPDELAHASAFELTIRYETDPESPGVCWLEKEQTAGKKLPFMYTQGQEVLNRSFFPCQDSPSMRVTYTASVVVPKELVCVMSAKLCGVEDYVPEDEGEQSEAASKKKKFTFEMKQSIPVYLVAMAVGDLVEAEVGPRSSIWTEPCMIDAATKEFDGVLEEYLTIGERLFGEYLWERCLDAKLGEALLREEISSLGEQSTLTRLRVPLEDGIDPGDCYNQCAYEKGYAFVCYLRSLVGSDQVFDDFLKSYCAEYRFQSIPAETMIAFFLKSFPELANAAGTDLKGDISFNTWLNEPGYPRFTPNLSDAQEIMQNCELLAFHWRSSSTPVQPSVLYLSEEAKQWEAQPVLYFLDCCLETEFSSEDVVIALGDTLSLWESHNSEILFRWALILIRNSVISKLSVVQRFLEMQGKQKFQLPVYRLLTSSTNDDVRKFATETYAATKNMLHVMVRDRIEHLLEGMHNSTQAHRNLLATVLHRSWNFLQLLRKLVDTKHRHDKPSATTDIQPPSHQIVPLYRELDLLSQEGEEIELSITGRRLKLFFQSSGGDVADAVLSSSLAVSDIIAVYHSNRQRTKSDKPAEPIELIDSSDNGSGDDSASVTSAASFSGVVNARRSNDSNGKRATAMPNRGLWTDVYAPKSVDDLCVNKKKVQEISEWLQRKASPSTGAFQKRLLFLCGPPGSGKSTAVRCIARQLGLLVKEWEDNSAAGKLNYERMLREEFWTPQESGVDDFADFIHRSSTYAALPITTSRQPPIASRKRRLSNSQEIPAISQTGQLILVESWPQSWSKEQRIYDEKLQRIYQHVVDPAGGCRYPVVCIYSDVQGSKIDLDHLSRKFSREVMHSPLTSVININAVTSAQLKKHLTRIATLESCVCQPTDVQKIIDSSNGDIRHALNMLQLSQNPSMKKQRRIHAAPNKKGKKVAASSGPQSKETSSSNSSARDPFLSDFHVVGKLLHGKMLQNKSVDESSVTSEPSSADYDQILDASAMPLDRVLGLVHENSIAYFSQVEDLSGALELMSLCEVMVAESYNGVTSSEAYKRSRDVAQAILMRTVAVTNENPAPKAFRPITRPRTYTARQRIVARREEMLQATRGGDLGFQYACTGDVFAFEVEPFLTIMDRAGGPATRHNPGSGSHASAIGTSLQEEVDDEISDDEW
ncbi:unnamed protein product [Phytophthora lilii]|uniref:Unnamed protein product n=1 Tax=Phytophthora lilii TaxID=2077276 RepID=A0A9W6WX07_9STRA|nr:unnamed protein product [Phytophthora lilii]